MKLQQLRFLDAVVRNHLNVSAAAEELHTSQPGVSHQIKLLEDELDIQIFERQGKKLTAITPAGHAILEHVGELLNSARNIKRSAREFARSDRGKLTIATTHTQAQFVLPPILERLARRYPQVELRMHQGNPRAMCRLAADNQVDFVIASELIDESDELVRIPAYRWNRCIVVPPDHALARMTAITLADLARFPILTYSLGLTGRSQLDKAFQRAGLEPRIAFTATDSDVIKTYVRLGLGAGIIAEMACLDSDSDLAFIDAGHLFQHSLIKVGFRRGRHLSAHQFDFIRMMAPHYDMDTIRRVADARDAGEREALLARTEIPGYAQSRAAREQGGEESRIPIGGALNLSGAAGG